MFDMNTLLPASEALDVANTGYIDKTKLGIVQTINSNFVTGEIKASYQGEFPDSIQNEIIGQGYNVVENPKSNPPGRVWEIVCKR